MIIIVALVLFFGYEGYNYLHFREKNAVSDAGFVKSDSLSILNFKVGGKVVKLNKKEGDSVKKGEILAAIDDRDFLVKKEEIKKTILSLKEQIASLKIKKERVKDEVTISKRVAQNSIKAYKKRLSSLKYMIDSNSAKLSQVKRDLKRYKKLISKKLISKDKFEQIHTKMSSLQSAINAQKKEYQSALQNLKNVEEKLNLAKAKELNIPELEKSISALSFKEEALEQKLKEVNDKISYCTLYAPFGGIVAKRFVNDKRVVKVGYPIYSIVDPNDIYAEVLLSEKKLRGVKKGCKVVLVADAVPKKKFKGVVESIMPTSASTFSLVPRDIASGEFTKLDQRFVVRIKLLDKKGLRVGMSLNVAIKRVKD